MQDTLILTIISETIWFLVILHLLNLTYKNKKKIKDLKKVRYPNGKLFWIHCFECENDMPVVEDKDVLYCSNCGLKH